MNCEAPDSSKRRELGNMGSYNVLKFRILLYVSLD